MSVNQHFYSCNLCRKAICQVHAQKNDIRFRGHHLRSHPVFIQYVSISSAVFPVRTQLYILDVHDWCASRRLQLNAQKTELVWFGSAANIHQMSAKNLTLSVGGDVIMPVEVVRDLDVYLDAELTMKHHVNRVTSNCFFQLRRLRQIRRQWALRQ